jgi:hypothetical protein
MLSTKINPNYIKIISYLAVNTLFHSYEKAGM